jgi:hypothetical protein
MKVASEEFGLWEVPDPRLPLPSAHSNPWTVAASISARYVYAVRSGDTDHDSLEFRFGRHRTSDTITIDLRADAPIEQQITYVKWVLHRVRSRLGLSHRQVPRFRRDLLGEYLRLLDARYDGASYKSIADHIFPCDVGDAEDRIRKRLEVAAQLRDGGYCDLLLWGKVKTPEFLNTIWDELDQEVAEQMT